MRARAAAAAAAIEGALSGLGADTTGRQMADAAAAAAGEAYDQVADREARARDRTTGGATSGGGGSGGGEGAGADVAPPVVVSDALLVQRPTFTAVMAAYVAGLLAAFVANGVTGLGQPALLYLVPSMLGALAVSGGARGELARLWAFTDVPSWMPKAPQEPAAR